VSDTYRSVGLERTGPGEFLVTNVRGGTLRIGGEDADFTPVELFLASLAGCAAVTVEEITGRRAAPERFAMTAEGHKRRDDDGAHMTDLRLLFDLLFPEGEDGDAARAIVPRTIAQTRDRLCTVSGTVHRGTPVEYVEQD
jgi:putative redox protein